MPVFHQIALASAKAGIPVFPITPGQKKPPLTEHGFKDATTDQHQINEWWRKWPEANVGMCPGPGGFVVLDVDIKSGDGMVELSRLQIEHGKLPENMPVVTTPSGGRHMWLRLPEGVEPPGNRQIAPHIDVRSGAGYVLSPGSVIDGKSYSLSSGDRLSNAPVLPARWAPLFSAPAPKLENEAPEELDHPSDVRRAIQHARSAEPATAGSRNAIAYKLACELRDYGLSAGKVHEIMAEEWNPRCEPPLDDGPEAEHNDALAQPVASAFRNARHREPGIQSIQNSKLMEIDTGAEPDDDDPIPPQRGRYEGAFKTEGEVDALEPPEWLIHDTLPRGALTMFYGAPGSHKSFLALDMASHLARGWDWAGCEIDDPAHVVYVAGEGGAGIQKRLRAWRYHHNADLTDNLHVLTSMPRVADPEDWSQFCDALAALHRDTGGIALIVFDTLARLTVGLEENSNTEMGRAVDALAALTARFGCTVMAVHHTGKDEGKGMRGAVALLGASDTVLAAKKVSATATSLEMAKQKDAEAWQGNINFSGQEILVGKDTKGRRITSLAFTAGHTSTVGEADRREQRQEARSMESQDHDFAVCAQVRDILRANGGAMDRGPLARKLAEEEGHDPTLAGDSYRQMLVRVAMRYPPLKAMAMWSESGKTITGFRLNSD